jgi:DNA integrity scanning protein DisA with diadenylate cyclase activity
MFICIHVFVFSYSCSSDLYEILGLQVCLEFIWRFLFIKIMVQSSYEVAIFREMRHDVICQFLLFISFASSVFYRFAFNNISLLSHALWRIYVLVMGLPSRAFNIIHNIYVVNQFFMDICVLLLGLYLVL